MKRFIISYIVFNLNIAAVTPTLLIKIPTRSRPTQFLKVLDLYYKYLSNSIPYKFLITCDSNDVTMNNPEMRARLASYPNLTVTFDDNKSKIEAYNNGLASVDFDIVLITSDDMEPVMPSYDKIIVDLMLEHFPDFDGVLNFNDGNFTSQCNTLPILGKKFFDRFEYAYHPSYRSLWCDVELTLVSRMLRKEKTSKIVLIRHKHPSNGEGAYDALYAQNIAHEAEDGVIFRQRLHNFFDIDPSVVAAICPKDWSILICCTQNDNAWQQKITKILQDSIAQLGLQDNIEIIIDSSNTELGHKRNEICRDCKGKYFNFIDPNTEIDTTYIQSIYTKLQENPDVVMPGNNLPLYMCPIKRIIGLSFVFIEREAISERVWEDFIRKGDIIKQKMHIDYPIITVPNR